MGRATFGITPYARTRVAARHQYGQVTETGIGVGTHHRKYIISSVVTMDCKECIPMVLHLRCAQTNVDQSKVQSVLDALQPKMDEAERNLQRRGASLKNMYCAFDAEDVAGESGGLDCMCLYPRLAPSVAAWSGVFNKTLGSQAFDLSQDERLTMKMLNYMVYTECVYANIVNQLCYILANSDSPCCLKELDCETNMESITRNVHLKQKIKFLRHNLPCIQSGCINIAYACNINLRNMIAHGSFAGNQSLVPYTRQQKLKRRMSKMIYVRRGFKAGWKWYKKPGDLDVAYKKIHDTTLIWHNALWCYWDMKFGPKCSS